jgi:hypothetical protein
MLYRNHRIEYDPKPIGHRGCDYNIIHESNDPETALCSTAASIDQAKQMIDEYLEEI